MTFFWGYVYSSSVPIFLSYYLAIQQVSTCYLASIPFMYFEKMLLYLIRYLTYKIYLKLFFLNFIFQMENLSKALADILKTKTSKKIVLFRHGEALAEYTGSILGWTNSKLTIKGLLIIPFYLSLRKNSGT